MPLPNVHFGEVTAEEVDWRNLAIDESEEDDDEELAVTPQDVIDGLGFDPLEEMDVDKSQHTGVMIAYIPPAEQQAALAMEGGELPEEIHLTLLYLGKELIDEQVVAVKKVVGEAATHLAPLQGTIGGRGRFPAAAGTEGKDVIIRMVDVPRLEALRETLIAALRSEGIEPVLNHGYTPHMTLAYVDPAFQGDCVHPEELPLVIDALTVAAAGEWETFPMVGSEVVKGNSCHSTQDGRFCTAESRNKKEEEFGHGDSTKGWMSPKGELHIVSPTRVIGGRLVGGEHSADPPYSTKSHTADVGAVQARGYARVMYSIQDDYIGISINQDHPRASAAALHVLDKVKPSPTVEVIIDVQDRSGQTNFSGTFTPTKAREFLRNRTLGDPRWQTKKQMEDAPNYRESATDQRCSTCVHGGDGYCDAYHFNTNSAFTCDSHELMDRAFDKYTPPQEVQSTARKAKEHYQTAEDKLSDEQVLLLMEALSLGRPLAVEEIRFMADYLSAHYEVEDEFSWKSHGPEWQAWNALGARAGLSWATRVLRKEQEQLVGKRLMEEWFAFGQEALMPEVSKVHIEGHITKVDEDKHLVFGWASVIEENGEEHTDRQGDTMNEDELEKMAYSYVLDCRDAGEMHKRVGVGKLVESIAFTKQKQQALGIDLGKVGWFVGFKVSDPDVWDKVKKGEYQAFSIHGRGRREKVE